MEGLLKAGPSSVSIGRIPNEEEEGAVVYLHEADGFSNHLKTSRVVVCCTILFSLI